jgi:UDP-2,3-diacylglucosamine pyrophosphatase LpxH
VDYLLTGWRGDLAGWQVRVDHGDGLRGAEDRKYRAVRPILRNPLAMSAYRHLLHPDWASRLALGTSAASRTYSAADNGEGLKAVAFRDLAADERLDMIVFGHSHVPALLTAPSGGVYGNAGTWLGDSTYLRVTATHATLHRWDGEGSSELSRVERPRR